VVGGAGDTVTYNLELEFDIINRKATAGFHYKASLPISINFLGHGTENKQLQYNENEYPAHEK
jgi:hypothetical protein